jgi:hypothetical protein
MHDVSGMIIFPSSHDHYHYDAYCDCFVILGLVAVVWMRPEPAEFKARNLEILFTRIISVWTDRLEATQRRCINRVRYSV